MAEDKKEDFDINLENMGLEDNLDNLLSEDTDNKKTKSEDDFVDFNDFSIDDLDTALSKYEESRNKTKAPVQRVADLKREEPTFDYPRTDELENKKVSDMPVSDIEEELNIGLPSVEDDTYETVSKINNDKDEHLDKRKAKLNDVSSEAEKKAFMNSVDKHSVDTNVEKDNVDYILTDELEQKLRNLVWYDGSLKEKVYEISIYNMPEFLDYNKDIHTIHVNIDSPYGWNVFFENGVFMNLMDLKEYQERNGKLPGRNGKIIYGSKTTAFEKIERIIVYQKPRYFSYAVEK